MNWDVVIVGVLTLIGTILTVWSGNRKTVAAMDKHQAVTDTKLEELTREVREHNNFARRMPVLEEKIQQLEKARDKA